MPMSKDWITRAALLRLTRSVLLLGGIVEVCSCKKSGGSPGARDAAVADARLGTTPNLVINGDAESAPGSSAGNVVVAAPGWTTSGEANVVAYGTRGGYPTATDPGPAQRGASFFSGGPNDSRSTF